MIQLIAAHFRDRQATVTTRSGEEMFPGKFVSVDTELHEEGLFYTLLFEEIEAKPYRRVAAIYYGNIRWKNNRWEAKSSLAKPLSSKRPRTSRQDLSSQLSAASFATTDDSKPSHRRS
jgi:hypothetical protein